VLTIDTSGLLALMDRRDENHRAAIREAEADDGPLIVPAGILSEAAYMIEGRVGSRFVAAFVSDLASGALALDCGADDFARIETLLARYEDLRLGFTDASVVACAERNGGRVLTFDRRDFSVVAREGTITLVPE
jgi:hypothetical protein